MTKDYKSKLRRKMDEYAHLVYKISSDFPSEEIYGSTSRIRRSVLSIVLNYIKGYARCKPAIQLNFYETSYGSLKESDYLTSFSKSEGWIKSEPDYQKVKNSRTRSVQCSGPK